MEINCTGASSRTDWVGVGVGSAAIEFVGIGMDIVGSAVSSAAIVVVGKLLPGITVAGTFSAAAQALIVMQEIKIKVSCFKIGVFTPQSLLL